MITYDTKVQPAGGESPAQAVEGILSPEQQRACVFVRVDGEPKGSGTLIHPRVVLTAAHVVRNDDGSMPVPPRRISVFVVDYGAEPRGCFMSIRQWARVQDVAEVFPGTPWEQIDLDNYGNDVALLWLEAPIQTWAALALPLGTTPPVGTACIIGGFSPWGEGHCAQRGFGRFALTQRELTSVYVEPTSTAAERGGDSGGPALRIVEEHPTVFGVVSAKILLYSASPGDTGFTVYPDASIISRVDTLAGWIEETIRRWVGGGRSPIADPPLGPTTCDDRWRLFGSYRETWAGGACLPPTETAHGQVTTDPVPPVEVPSTLAAPALAPLPPTDPQPPPSGPTAPLPNGPAKPSVSGGKVFLWAGGVIGLLGLGLWWWKRGRT